MRYHTAIEEGRKVHIFDLTVPESKVRDFVEECEEEGDDPALTLAWVDSFWRRQGHLDREENEEFYRFLNLIP